MTIKPKYTPLERQRIKLRAQRKLGKAKQSDGTAHEEFMEECIDNLEGQGVDDAEESCEALWMESDEE